MAVFFFTAHEKGFKFHAQPQIDACSCSVCSNLIDFVFIFIIIFICHLQPLVAHEFKMYLFCLNSLISDPGEKNMDMSQVFCDENFLIVCGFRKFTTIWEVYTRFARMRSVIFSIRSSFCPLFYPRK